MKTLLLNSFLLFFVFQSFTQIPNYFENNPTWSSGYWLLGQAPQDELNEEFVYYLNGDTTIQGNTFSKIHRKGYQNYFNGGPTGIWFNESTKIYVRQVGRSIRFSYNHSIDNDDIWDSLLVDYNLQVGDTVQGHIFLGLPDDTIQKIDSVLINTEYRVVMYTDTILGTSFTEGIGHQWQYNFPSGEIFLPFISGLSGNKSFIYCYGQNNVELWDSYGSPGNCNLNLSIKEMVKKSTQEVVKIIDLMGRETENKPNTLLIYIYSDGTTEKVFRME